VIVDGFWMDRAPVTNREFRAFVEATGYGANLTEVSIADSGSGIPADKLQQIFEPFFTTKDKGTGLGLAIARTIIERFGGEISAENRPNGGAVFRFSLPLVKELVA
jgi:signal transduction histidine kinase